MTNFFNEYGFVVVVWFIGIGYMAAVSYLWHLDSLDEAAEKKRKKKKKR